ncbi:FH1/FH2 domain-containing protein 1-like isoform X2 [Corapipo altera]|uniref:FH1/FH2 domain-containing protein 1-like isoform X2 n=1 Tax=Corapipo altera TaxID=415028 RepID=UPI000FD68B5E|nr:FH1/FH2 domain-containing protein 1-like isoform X2 [Corapipo altera]
MTDKVPPKVLDKFTGMVPLGRLGDPEDMVTFLVSGDSGYVTGATLEVTGGDPPCPQCPPSVSPQCPPNVPPFPLSFQGVSSCDGSSLSPRCPPNGGRGADFKI